MTTNLRSATGELFSQARIFRSSTPLTVLTSENVGIRILPQGPALSSHIVITRDLVSTEERASAVADALVLSNDT